jgi:hypothetical protein
MIVVVVAVAVVVVAAASREDMPFTRVPDYERTLYS